MNDQLQRFIIDETDIRGELVQLGHCYKDILAAHAYPKVVQLLLGEFIAAAALLSATLKFDGTISLQARSDGEIPLIMAEANSKNTLRAIARAADEASSTDFHTLLANGQLTLTVEPTAGKRYQGIVALEGDNLAQCIENYFRQSEQLSTRIWLTSTDTQVAGMMLQELPVTNDSNLSQRENNWEHITQLANTLTQQELLSLESNELLYRLYNQEQVRVFTPTKLSFQCSCSRDRTLNALRTVGQTELNAIISEQGSIETNCEFCHQHYLFNSKDIEYLFNPPLH